jgi:nucleoside-diphosphate-sugar epimerase
MARVFQTGTNGFIGSHLCELLLSQGHEVVGLVRPTSDVRSLQPLFVRYPGQLRLVTGDLRSGEGLAAGLEDAEYVYHLGAVLMVTSEAEFRAVIVDGTRRLLEAVTQNRPKGLRRFLYVSSQAGAGPSPTAQPIDETVPPRPVSWYGRAKRDAEDLVRSYGGRGLPVTIVRPVGVFGERERDISGGTFPAVQLGLLPHIGSGKKTVSMVYVGDLVQGMIAAAQSPAAQGRTYFLSNPQPYAQSEFIADIAKAMGTRVRISVPVPGVALSAIAVFAEWLHRFTNQRPMVTRDKAREVRQQFWSVTPKAAQRDFGWAAQTTLVDGMRKAISDWKARRQRARLEPAQEPGRDRAVKCYTLALLLGAVAEILAEIGKWYEFTPRWLIFPVIAGYGLAFGTLSLVSVRWSPLPRFLCGAAVFIAAELSNHFWLHAWEFAPEPFGRLPVPYGRALVLSIPIGLMPVVTNAVSAALYRARLRVGA